MASSCICARTTVGASAPQPSNWPAATLDSSRSLGSAGPEHYPGAATIAMERGRRYIVNVGSVGQPRDRDPRAAYALWDAEAGRVEIRRVAYDVAAARRKILAAGLPRFLADRLEAGA